ncbi:hypothetical protein, partial [Escherichia coli]
FNSAKVRFIQQSPSLAVSVLGFVVTAPLWIYVSRLVS